MDDFCLPLGKKIKKAKEKDSRMNGKYTSIFDKMPTRYLL